MKKPVVKTLEIISLAAGLALFDYMMKQVGLGALAHYLRAMGRGFALIIALSFIRTYARRVVGPARFARRDFRFQIWGNANRRLALH
jgi:hypothetical protein